MNSRATRGAKSAPRTEPLAGRGPCSGRIRITHPTVISHPIISNGEIETPRGQERFATCAAGDTVVTPA